jgi:hypothetical protein
METVGDFMEDWIKKWKQELSWQERWDANGWHKEDELSEELDDYWGQEDEEDTDQQPKKHIRRVAKNRIIREAIEENKVYDIDRLFWNGGKLFGCDVIQNDPLETKAYGMSLYRLDYHSKENGKNYLLEYEFDWKRCALMLSYFKYGPNAKPYKARIELNFHTLFDVKFGMEQMVFEHAAESVIREVEKLIDDDKKDNRNS